MLRSIKDNGGCLNEQIKVSVIVVTYNHEKYIAKAINSILAQETDFKYEILIGDDASTDSTADIVMQYASQNPDIIKAVCREKNVGATKNAYSLLKSAKGKYLATLEGDDMWTDVNKLKLQVDFLEDNPQFIACAHKFYFADEEGLDISV